MRRAESTAWQGWTSRNALLDKVAPGGEQESFSLARTGRSRRKDAPLRLVWRTHWGWGGWGGICIWLRHCVWRSEMFSLCAQYSTAVRMKTKRRQKEKKPNKQTDPLRLLVGSRGWQGCPSLLQTSRHSPMTFLKSSLSFKKTLRAPLGNEKPPLVLPFGTKQSR